MYVFLLFFAFYRYMSYDHSILFMLSKRSRFPVFSSNTGYSIRKLRKEGKQTGINRVVFFRYLYVCVWSGAYESQKRRKNKMRESGKWFYRSKDWISAGFLRSWERFCFRFVFVIFSFFFFLLCSRFSCWMFWWSQFDFVQCWSLRLGLFFRFGFFLFFWLSL